MYQNNYNSNWKRIGIQKHAGKVRMLYIVWSGHVLFTYMIIFLGIFWLAKAPKPGEKNRTLCVWCQLSRLHYNLDTLKFSFCEKAKEIFEICLYGFDIYLVNVKTIRQIDQNFFGLLREAELFCTRKLQVKFFVLTFKKI